MHSCESHFPTSDNNFNKSLTGLTKGIYDRKEKTHTTLTLDLIIPVHLQESVNNRFYSRVSLCRCLLGWSVRVGNQGVGAHTEAVRNTLINEQ